MVKAIEDAVVDVAEAVVVVVAALPIQNGMIDETMAETVSPVEGAMMTTMVVEVVVEVVTASDTTTEGIMVVETLEDTIIVPLHHRLPLLP